MKDNKVVYEIKLEKSVKLILTMFALGVFLNAVGPENLVSDAFASEYLTHSGTISVNCYGCN